VKCPPAKEMARAATQKFMGLGQLDGYGQGIDGMHEWRLARPY